MKGSSLNRLLISALKVLACVAVVIVAADLLLCMRPHPYRPPYTQMCLSNIRSCADAVIHYTESYDGHLPSSALVSGSKKWNKADFETFAMGAHARPMNPGEKPKTWTQIVSGEISEKDITLCPLDPHKGQQGGASSYWWKLAIDKAWYGVGCKKPARKISDFPYYESSILLYERNCWHEGQSPVGLKNDLSVAVAFMDGHVRLIKLRNATSGDPINCVANSDGEPMYFNYNEKTNGWFADTAAPATWVDPSECSDHHW